MVAWIIGLLIMGGVGCASHGPETPQTEVDGAMVYDGEIDEDAEFSDEEVERFAAAYVEVTAIQQDYQRQMQEAEDEGERARLGQESSQRSEEAMAEHGLSSQEFNAIAVRLPQDEELRNRVQEAVQGQESQRIEETERLLEE